MFLRSIGSWLRMNGAALRHKLRHGMPRVTGDPAGGIVFLLDGVGGIGLVPALVRAAVVRAKCPLATYYFYWHRGVPGDMLSDLMWLRANRRAALRLARIVREYRRRYPDAPLHIVGYSGGAGVAVFAAEKLGRRTMLDTLVLGAPAISAEYQLEGALRNVRKCVAFTSSRDVFLVGLGTSVFGTIDRRFGPAAGLTGFKRQPAGDADGELWTRFSEVAWQPEMAADGHCGHHTGAASVEFIRKRILPLLRSARQS